MRSDPWADIASAGMNEFRARRHPDTSVVWFAMDHQERRHLLVELEVEQEERTLFSVRGLTAKLRQLSPDGGSVGSWIDIACSDVSAIETFGLLTRELVEAAASTGSERLEKVSEVLDRWRWFWSHRPAPLSEAEELGLFAELWFLQRWLAFPASLQFWRGPDGGRHDFVSDEVSVEVKATQVGNDSAPTHKISSLDQLDDPFTGKLYLFSLAVVIDHLSTNTLEHIVGHLTAQIAGTPLAHVWEERLSAAGWSSGHAEFYRQPYRIKGEALYKVDNGFPRLIPSTFERSSVPPGVEDVRYSIDLSVVRDTHRVATSPSESLLGPLRWP